MKIRTGFVSNSSSSSFVFALPRDFDPVELIDLAKKKKPERWQEWLREMLTDYFENDISEDELIENMKKGLKLLKEHSVDHCYESYYEELMPVESLASMLGLEVAHTYTGGSNGEVIKLMAVEDLERMVSVVKEITNNEI